MAIGETVYVNSVREQLLAGRARLSDVMGDSQSEQVLRLLNEVDSALRRIDHGTFGVCEICAGTVEEDRLRENPLARVCLDCLTPKQQRALEYDLELAGEIQKGLLPCNVAFDGWDIDFHYQPAGVVSGDYCDVMRHKGYLYFILADVSGKGVAAAMLASNLRAVFRSLVPLELSVEDFLVRANRLFRESALPSQYATTVFGRTSDDGEVELVNVGHLPVLLKSDAGISRFESTCRPLGIFADDVVCTTKAQMLAGDMLVIYSDGIEVTFAEDIANDSGEEYGVDAVSELLGQHELLCPARLVETLKRNIANFRAGAERADDETLLAIQYAPAATAN